MGQVVPFPREQVRPHAAACPSCAARLSQGAEVCRACGASLVDPSAWPGEVIAWGLGIAVGLTWLVPAIVALGTAAH